MLEVLCEAKRSLVLAWVQLSSRWRGSAYRQGLGALGMPPGTLVPGLPAHLRC